MGLVDRLKAIIEGMPDGGSVSLPVTWLRIFLTPKVIHPAWVDYSPLKRLASSSVVHHPLSEPGSTRAASTGSS
jgi:hypothetical protein